TAFDVLLQVAKLPSPNKSVPVKARHIRYGGGAANICCGIAKLGGATELISSVGYDFSTSDYHTYLKDMGIELTLNICEDMVSPVAYVVSDETDNQVTYFFWGASEQIKNMKPVAREFVHLATGDPEYNHKTARLSKYTSFDPGQDLPNYTSEELWAVLRHSNMLICNRYEMGDILNMLEMSLSTLLQTLTVIIVTADAEGSTVYTRNEEHHVDALSVKVADPTGAGDEYRAGLFTAMQLGYDMITCLRIATVAASFVIEGEGAQSTQPSWSKIMERFTHVYGEASPEPTKDMWWR
ncbi:MAG: carbohydrate kinase family protein, partial [Methermicoccaceae archaeon]